jgi:hypothetical protein
MLLVQLPVVPFLGAVAASQVFATHVAGENVPSLLHDDGPLTVKAGRHVGWQLAPAFKLS